MSKNTIYIKCPDYLAQWLKHEFWSDEEQRVKFPRGSAEHVIMQMFITKRRYVVQPSTAGLLAVEVPQVPRMNPAVYCDVTESGKKTLISTIKLRFKKQMWEELHVIFPMDVQITDLIYAYLEKVGIEPTPKNWETVRQMYARMRKTYERS
jgi:hypothetical protein